VPTTTASQVVARVAAYWVVDGVVVVWAATIARRHGFGGWGLLLRGIVVALIGLWILISPATETLGGPQRVGWFVSFLVLVPALLFLVTVQGVFAAIVDFLVWLTVRRDLPGEWSGLLSAALAVATSVLVWRSILGVAHPRVAALLTIAAGIGFIACAVRLRGPRRAA